MNGSRDDLPKNIGIYHVKPISLLDVSKDKGMRETFNWKKTSTNSKKENLQKGTNKNYFIKIRHQLQFFISYKLLKLIED